MSLTKSVLLGVHCTLKTSLKRPTTLALTNKYSNIDLDNKEREIKPQNSKISETPDYLQCFERTTRLDGRSGDPFWDPIGGQKSCSSYPRDLMEWLWQLVSWKVFFSMMSLKQSLLLMLHRVPKQAPNRCKVAQKWFEITFKHCAIPALIFT